MQLTRNSVNGLNMSLVDQLRKRLLAEKKPKKQWDGLSTGLTLLDLGISGQPGVGILPGHFVLLVGGARAGKTWLLLQIMAEAVINKQFRRYHLVHDNPERGSLMSIRNYFGKLADRKEDPPSGRHSETLEGFYDNVARQAKLNEPFIYGLDSEDALPPEAEIKKVNQDRRHREKGKDITGSYGTAKPKINSANLRIAHNSLEKHGSILIMIKQARDTIGPKARFTPETRSGGRALTFYASLELWFSVVGKIKRKLKVVDKDWVIGSWLKVKVVKNRVAGRDCEVVIPFYPNHGFDNIGSMINWMVDMGQWPTYRGGIVEAKSLGFRTTQEKLIQKIEAQGMENDLIEEVTKTWRAIEEASAVKRKNRYNP